MIPDWVNRYVGIDYAQQNCFDLVRSVYEDIFHIEMLDIDGERARRRAGGWHRIIKPRPGDVLMFRSATTAKHVAINLDGVYMLHADRTAGTVIERWRQPVWQQRLCGVYRCNITA